MNISNHRPRGFTIIELLIVVAIIAVLFSLALPSLMTAREAARTGTCLARQRTVGVYIESYRNDKKFWYPANRTWFIDYWGNGPQVMPVVDEPNQLGRFLVQIGAYFPEGVLRTDRFADASKNQMLCPGVDFRPPTDYDVGALYAAAYVDDGVQLTSYMPNTYFGYGNLVNQDRYWWPKKEIKGVSPARLTMVADVYGSSGSLGYGGGTGDIRYSHPNHTFNTLFGDGSARNLQGTAYDRILDNTMVMSPTP